MTTKMFLLLAFLSFSTAAYALPVGPLTVPCESGNLVVSGDYNPVNGQFSLNLTATNCKQGDITSNGNATSNGTFQMVTSSSATLNLSFTYQFNIAGSQISGTQSCTGTLNGAYNLSTETFQGSENRTCNSTGTARISLVDILFGLED